MYRIVFLMYSSLLLVSACKQKPPAVQRLPYYNEASFTPLFIQNEKDLTKQITHTIAPFSLLNQDSTRITQHIVEGKIHIANFMFTTCASICPVMTKHMKILSDSLQEDSNIVLLSYTVTPWIDKPHVLKAYAAQHNIDNKNWHFLTGAKGDIYTLARQSYFAEESIGFSKDSTEFLHTEHFLLVDETKRIRGIYNGTLSLEMKMLLDDVKTLKAETNENL